MEPILNYIPENIKLTDFRYQPKQIKQKLLEEKKVLLLVDRAKQIALLVPVDLLRSQLPVGLTKSQKKIPWPAYHLGEIKIPLTRTHIYESF